MNNDKTEAEALVESVMAVKDWRKMDVEGLTAREYVRKHRGVDPDDYTDEDELHAAVLSARKLNGDPDHKGTNSDGDDDETAEGGKISASVGVDPRQYGDSSEEIAALSQSVMTVSDLRQMDAEGLSAREYVAEQHGVDPAEFRSEADLQEAIAEEKA